MNLVIYLTPELKHDRAQASQRGAVARLKSLLEHYTRDELTVDDLECVALQLRLASVNLMGCARELREVETERKLLLKELERDRLRFETEPESEGGAA